MSFTRKPKINLQFKSPSIEGIKQILFQKQNRKRFLQSLLLQSNLQMLLEKLAGSSLIQEKAWF